MVTESVLTPHHTVAMTILYHTTPRCTIPYHTIPHHTTPHHTIPYHTTHSIPYHITPYHTTSHHITSHHITPHHTTPHHTTPHHTIPHTTHTIDSCSTIIVHLFLCALTSFTVQYTNLVLTRHLEVELK